MRIVGMMPVRNEDWILGLSARVALAWCNDLVVLNHASTDKTADIISDLSREYPGRVHTISAGGDWTEMEHRQQMLERARTLKATHVAIVDADEVLTANIVDNIREAIAKMQPGWIMQLPGYNLRTGIDCYHLNGIWGHRWFSVAFADNPSLHWSGDRFHHRDPMGLYLSQWQAISHGSGGILHFWGASERRLKAKHALYKLTEVLRWPNKPIAEIDRTYGLAFHPEFAPEFDQKWKYASVPIEWVQPYAVWNKYLNVDGEPWQERECARIIAEFGAERFAGLDLFGVPDLTLQ